VHGTRVEDHGGWSFTSVIGSLSEKVDVKASSRETRRAEWVRVEELEDRKLFAPFERSWPGLREAMKGVVLVVDGANVVGSRPDGWWKDRAGANARLRDGLAGLAARNEGVRGVPPELAAFDRCYPEIVLVVEGAARPVADEQVEGVRVVAAPGSGDDHIVDLVRRPDPDTGYLVVTADRELRARCREAGAHVTGPRWLTDRIGRR
jgi:hypothetical protein